MSEPRSLIHSPYSTPNIGFKALEKEQPNNLLENKPHISFDELPRIHHNGKICCGLF
jgi:hypothetical protein